MVAFAALFEARLGSAEKAIALREHTELGLLNPFYQAIYQLTEYAVEFRQTGTAYPQLITRAKELYPDYASNPISRKVFSRSLERFLAPCWKRNGRDGATGSVSSGILFAETVTAPPESEAIDRLVGGDVLPLLHQECGGQN